ncbi:MAG: bifunctional transcriptional activator/DNA repair enzyme AdaA [Phycisphaerae bacterium]
MNTNHMTLPPVARMYRALLERDAAFEGVFVVGVTTTRIFCSPACSAKKPRRENCAFFTDAREALRAGFRACLRCRPLERGRAASPLVARLLDLIEHDGEKRVRDADLRALGIDPTTARRAFHRHCGMTFQNYQRARRMGLALADLRANRDLPRAMDLAGYESWSGFGAAFAGVFGRPPSKAEAIGALVADWIPTPLGPMVAVASDAGLVLLEFHDRRALERELRELRQALGVAIVPGESAVLRQIRGELDEYFAGERTAFETPLVIRGGEFERRVWSELAKIPAGETRSYRQIATAIGTPQAVRAVGRANGQNPLAIVVPCHRVIRSDGALCGYGGGVWRKRRLLEHEAAIGGRLLPALTRSAPAAAGTRAARGAS